MIISRRTFLATSAGLLAPAQFVFAQRVRRLSAPQQSQWTYSATAFSGSGQYLSRSAFTGAVTSTSGTVSLWFKSAANGVVQYLLFFGNPSTVSRLDIYKAADNKINIRWRNGAASAGAVFTSTAAITDSAWHHLYVSVDTLGAVTTNRAVWLDGSAWAGSWSLFTEAQLAWNLAYIGIAGSNAGGGLFTGSFSEIALYPGSGYRDPATYLTAFRSAGGKPVDLGATGAKPWGQVPLYYGHGSLLADTSGNNQTFTANGPPTVAADKP